MFYNWSFSSPKLNQFIRYQKRHIQTPWVWRYPLFIFSNNECPCQILSKPCSRQQQKKKGERNYSSYISVVLRGQKLIRTWWFQIGTLVTVWVCGGNPCDWMLAVFKDRGTEPLKTVRLHILPSRCIIVKEPTAGRPPSRAASQSSPLFFWKDPTKSNFRYKNWNKRYYFTSYWTKI